MRQVVYDVAVSLDGFISGPDDDVSGFLQTGDHVDAYWARMATYETVLMGRKTYEYGYAHGLSPGHKAYPHMDHYILSTTLQLPTDSPVQVVREDWLGCIDRLKAGAGGDIYLCGGGALAGLLLREGRLDVVILKVNPVVLGSGTPLFEDASRSPMRLRQATPYQSGVVLLEYEIGAR